MSYRVDKPKPRPKAQRTLTDKSTPLTLYIDYGEMLDFAIPCYYMEPKEPVAVFPHNRNIHDMLGWPRPDKPDDSCQESEFGRPLMTPHMHGKKPRIRKFIDPNCLMPIHLSEEFSSIALECALYLKTDDGYSNVSNAFTCAVDPERDWIIRSTLSTVAITGINAIDMVSPDAEARELFMSIILNAQDSSNKQYKQRVAQGRIVVCPSPVSKE